MSSFFTAPWMLAWLGALAVPILIHLFARQRFRPVPWAAMELLQRAFKKLRRRLRLEHLLLLLLRLLALLLLVLALAGPILSGDGQISGAGLSGGRRELILIVDDSFSTDLKGQDGTPEFARIQSSARSLIASLRRERGDTVTLIKASKPATLVFRSDSDLDRAAAEVLALERSDQLTDLQSSLEIAVAVLDQLGTSAEVWLLSDLQRSAFVPESSAEVSEANTATAESAPEKVIQARLLDLRAREAQTTVLLPRTIPTDNSAITRLSLRSKAAISGVPLHFEVAVTNFAAEPRGGRVDLFVEGRSDALDIRDIDVIPPGGTVVLDFHHTFREAKSHAVTARFLDDNLERDNRRMLAVDVREQLDVLIVDGDPKSDPGESESFFLSAALDPGSDDGAATKLFVPEVVDEARFARVDLNEVDLLVLMDVNLLSSERVERIERFVREGGGLWIFLGDRTNAGTLNELFWRGGQGVLPAKLLTVAGEENAEISYRLRVERFDHPALAYFEDPGIMPWLTEIPPFQRFFRTEVDAEDATVRVLAEFELPGVQSADRAPALVERRFGEGRALLFSTSGNRSWNDLPALPTWLLLTREVALYLSAKDATRNNLLVGSRFERRLTAPATSAALSRDGETLEELPVLSPEGSTRFDLMTGPLERRGLYRLDLRGQPETGLKDLSPLSVAVNVDPRESRLDRVDQAWLENQFPAAGLRFVSEVDEDTEGPGQRDQRRGWWWFLALAGLFFGLETVLAQLFGSRRESGGQS